MRVLINGQIYVYAEAPNDRRRELWEGVAQDSGSLNKIASNDKMQDINKVESAVDLAADLRLKLRELGVW